MIFGQLASSATLFTKFLVGTRKLLSDFWLHLLQQQPIKFEECEAAINVFITYGGSIFKFVYHLTFDATDLAKNEVFAKLKRVLQAH